MTDEVSDCGCKHSKLNPSEGPALALMDGDAGETSAFACGDGGCPTELPERLPPIKAVRIERVRKNAEGVYEISEEKHVDLAESFGGASDSDNYRGSVSWLRPPTRNLKKFSEWLKEAHKMGQMTDSLQLYKALKKYVPEEEQPGAQEQEVFYTIVLNTQLYVIGMFELARGARDRVMAPIPDILRLPLIEGAMSFVVGHCHPSAKVQPSDADKDLTKALQEAAAACELRLMDHIIWGAETDDKPNYYSFYDNRLIK